MVRIIRALMGGIVDSEERPALDRFWVSRLLLGALSEHEQRALLVRLLRLDANLRRDMAPFLQPFALGDHERLGRFESALASGVDPEVARLSLLDRDSEAELGELIRAFTFQDLFQLGESSRRLFSWEMAEHLMGRSSRTDVDLPTRRTSYFLATLVVDGLEILAATEVAKPHPHAIADLRRRMALVGATLRPGSP